MKVLKYGILKDTYYCVLTFVTFLMNILLDIDV